MKRRNLVLTAIIVLGCAAMGFIAWYRAHLEKSAEQEQANIGQAVPDAEMAESARKYQGIPPATPVVRQPVVNMTKPIRVAVGSTGLADVESDRQLSDLILTELKG